MARSVRAGKVVGGWALVWLVCMRAEYWQGSPLLSLEIISNFKIILEIISSREEQYFQDQQSGHLTQPCN